MKTVELECEICNKKFNRLEKEAKRCAKKGFSITCGMKCAGIMRNKKSPKSGDLANFGDKRKIGSSNDEFSPFRYFLKKAKERIQHGEHDLDLIFLKNLWQIQKGICPYTGKLMILSKNTRDHDQLISPLKASLDRIDPTKGYIQGNVEFVCLAVNYAKNSFSREQMINFFKK